MPRDQAPADRSPESGDAASLPTSLDVGSENLATTRTQPPSDPLVGQIVAARYKVEQRLGVGGMGAVYRAVHVHMRKTVALKVLHRQMTYIPEAVARFEREAVAAARIEHPNVAAATDFGRLDDGSFYLALEFVEGVSLRQIMAHGLMPVPRAVGIVIQIAQALQAAHAQGVVHRDLKPENVMLMHRGRDLVKVLDFGIAKVSDVADDTRHLTHAGSVFGTPDYMSPEQAAGRNVDARSDLYTLGVLFYELLAGETPFSGDAPALVLTKHLHEPPPPLPSSVDFRLVDLVKRLLAKEPDARPQTAQAVADELLRTRLSVIPVRNPSTWPKKVGRVALPILRRTWLQIRRGVNALLRLAEPGWRKLTLKAPWLEALERPVKLGSFAPAMGWLLLCAVLGLVLVGLFMRGGHEAPSARVTPSEVATPAAASPAASPAPTLEDKQQIELTDLLALPVYKRKLPDWLRLAELQQAQGQWQDSTAAYRNALQLDKDTAKNPKVLLGIRQAAEQMVSYEAAINIAINLLGESGVDLIFDLWQSTRDNPKQRLINEFAYKKLDVVRARRASPALKIRLDLEFKSPDCEPVQKTVHAALHDADQRSVQLLEGLRKTDGCGASKTRDCYPCLREKPELEDAIEAAKARPAPELPWAKAR